MTVNMTLPICYFIILRRSPPVPFGVCFGVHLVWGNVLEVVKQIKACEGIYLLKQSKGLAVTQKMREYKSSG